MSLKQLAITALALLIICMNGVQSVQAGGPTSGDPTATAKVKGEVHIDGVVPKPKVINMAADPSCMKQHSGPVYSQEIMADAKGGLQNVIVFISDGLGDRTFNAPADPATIKQKGCLFEPHVLAVQANQPLEIENDDPTSHNIHPLPQNNREWNKAEIPGSKLEEAFPREEIAIPVKCNIHPWMRGYVAVFKHPYYAVTGKDGSFNLPNLPPGTYTIEAWHEALGTSKQQITIGGNETKDVQFVFKAKAM